MPRQGAMEPGPWDPSDKEGTTCAAAHRRAVKRNKWVLDFKNTSEFREAVTYTQMVALPMPDEPDSRDDNISKRRWVKVSEQWTDAVRELARVARRHRSEGSCALQ